MFGSTKMMLAFTVATCLSGQGVEAFAPQAGRMAGCPMTTALHAESSNNNPSTTRRGALFGIVGVVGSTLIGSPDEASARYSSYAHREQDWEERQKNGEVNFKSARDLRNEMQELVPQNNAGSKIFCPNGAPSAVSPLMENKCGDRLAAPSVYGRSNDSVGNSIPGFSTSKATDLKAVGFPSYK